MGRRGVVCGRRVWCIGVAVRAWRVLAMMRICPFVIDQCIAEEATSKIAANKATHDTVVERGTEGHGIHEASIVGNARSSRCG